jgi:hypothetical protein
VEIFEVKFAARSNFHHDRIGSGGNSRKLLDLTNREVVKKLFHNSELNHCLLQGDLNGSRYLVPVSIRLILVRYDS